MISYNPSKWYWLVGNKRNFVFSSALPGYVSLTDAGYVAFLADGGTATPVPTDGELADVLVKAGQPVATIAAAGMTDFGFVPPADIGAIVTAVGLQVTSTATPALNGSYAIDASSQAAFTSESVYIQVTGSTGTAKFTNGLASKAWPDINRGMHTFTTAQFITFAEAVAGYVDALTTAIAVHAAGGPLSLPAQPVTIP